MKLTERKIARERVRLLTHLSRAPAQLERPVGNPVFEAMVEEGLIAVTRSYQAHWNNSLHEMYEYALTEAGRLALSDSAPEGGKT